MVETITPVVHGSRRGRYGLAVALHTLGAAASAALLGAALGGVGGLLGAPWGEGGLYLLLGVAVIYAAREAFNLPIPLLDRSRQVPDWWRTFYSPTVSAFLYGTALGIGYLTFLSFGTFVAVGVAALASGHLALGALLCAPFGLARGLAVAIAARRDPQAAGELVDRLEVIGQSGAPRRVNALALTALVAVAALALF